MIAKWSCFSISFKYTFIIGRAKKVLKNYDRKDINEKGFAIVQTLLTNKFFDVSISY